MTKNSGRDGDEPRDPVPAEEGEHADRSPTSDPEEHEEPEEHDGPATHDGPASHDEHEVEHEVTSLRRLFAERRLSIATMDRPLRVATAGAVASVLVTVLMLALRDVGSASVYLGRSQGAVTQIGQPLFIAVLVLISLGFGYLYAAVSLTSLWIATPAALVMTFGIGVYTGALGGIVGGLDIFEVVPAWVRWTDRAILVVLVLLCIGARALDHSRKQEPRTRILLVVAFAALIGAYLGIFRIGMPTLGGLNLYGATIDAILSTLVFAMWPILQVAAVDFGEWGQLTGERLTHAVARGRQQVLWVIGGVAALAMAAYGYYRMQDGFGAFSRSTLLQALRGISLLLLAICLIAAVFYGLGLERRRWKAGISFAALVGATALTGVILPNIVASITGAFSHLRPAEVATEKGEYAPGADVLTQKASTGPTAFSFQVPRGWIVHNNGKSVQASSYDGKGGYERVAALALPVVDLPVVEQAFGVKPAEDASFDGWQGTRFTGKDETEGYVWIRPVGNPNASGTYAVYEAVQGSTFTLESATPVFKAVLASFRGDGAAPAPLPPPEKEAETPEGLDNHRLALNVAFGLGLALIVLLVGLAVWRRWRPQWIAGGLVLGVISMFTLLYNATGIGAYLFGESRHLPHLSETGVLFGAGILGLAAVLAVRARDEHGTPTGRLIIGGVIGLEGALAALELMMWLYGKALSAARISVWAAIILLVAVVWDVTMSGESMTNHGTSHLPRATRVLGFFGYTILLAGTVLFYTSEKVISTGHAAESFFEPEDITRNALFRVAFPVLLLAFFIRLARAHGSAAPAPDAPEPRTPLGVAAGPSAASTDPDSIDPASSETADSTLAEGAR